MIRVPCCFAAGMLGCCLAFAHGDLHERITALAAQITAAPSAAPLYLQRAELSRQHADWQAALADCDKAQLLDPATDGALLRGRILLESGRPLDALLVLDGYVGRHPQHTQAWACRARTLAMLGRHAEAIAGFREALQRSPQPEPDLYVECAAALTAQGNAKAAVQVLDEGLAKLGAIPSLALRAIDIDLAMQNFEAALVRVELIRQHAPRPEPWMAKRASVLAQAGRLQDSHAAWQALVAHLAKLPEPERRSHAMSKLMAQARQALASLDSLRPANESPPITPPHTKS